jgi:hypothetical protein
LLSPTTRENKEWERKRHFFSLCNLGWSQTLDPLASATQVLELQAGATRQGKKHFLQGERLVAVIEKLQNR